MLKPKWWDFSQSFVNLFVEAWCYVLSTFCLIQHTPVQKLSGNYSANVFAMCFVVSKTHSLLSAYVHFVYAFMYIHVHTYHTHSHTHTHSHIHTQQQTEGPPKGQFDIRQVRIVEAMERNMFGKEFSFAFQVNTLSLLSLSYLQSIVS